MNILIIGAIVLLLISIFFYLTNNKKDRNSVKQIRDSWGKSKVESFYFEGIRSFSELEDNKRFHRLSEQTINDIDFYSLFKFIDRTTSKIGQQFLFKKLIEPTNNKTNSSQSLIELFENDIELREQTQLQLLRLTNADVYYISTLLQESLLERPKWLKYLKFEIFLVVILLLLTVKFPSLFLLILLIFSFNLLLHYWNKVNGLKFIKSFPQLNTLINVSKILLETDKIPNDSSIESHIKNLRPFQKKLNLINFDNDNGLKGEIEFLTNYLLELIKGIFLIEVFTLFKVTKELEVRQSSVLSLFNFVGEVDTCISIASLRAGSSKTCIPNLNTKSDEVILEKIYHPLVENCVTNDLVINQKSILITGSNMSGKSTFLRTFCINSILAQTIYTCFGDKFHSPILKQYSSIRIDDNLFEGKSYYFEEVSIMASLISEVDNSFQNLFILDEIFKGTNTIERIAAAKAILSFLNRNNNIVMVATHDIELSEMLKDEYELFHFTELIENDELHFDHKIKTGQLRTRNAIKLLELSNYPTDIVVEAKRISEYLQGKGEINE
jgi:DNA mismatch repair ATPase MutS